MTLNKLESAIHVEVDGIFIKIRRSSVRKKSVGFKISQEGGACAIFPSFISEEEILSILKKKIKWIQKHVAEAKSNMAKKGNGLAQVTNGVILPFKGDNYQLNIRSCEPTPLQVMGDKIIITLGKEVQDIDRNSLIRAQLLNWYHQEALLFLKKRVAYFSKMMGVFVQGITIKNSKSFWGRCCYNSKVLEFNWKAVILPLYLIDYLIVHELAHIKHPNHSKAFWKFVDRFFDHNSIRGQLRKISFDL